MSRAALLVMDVQNGIVERFADGSSALLDALGRATAAARSAGVAVIFVRVAFRPSAPEVSPSNLGFSRLSGSSEMSLDDPATQIHPSLGPAPGDIVVVKKRVSAFVGSDLEVVLRSLGVETLVLSGIATSGVVLSTLRQAADADYRLSVLADGCLDSDAEVHRVLLEKVFTRQASVFTTEEWVRELAAPSASA